MKAHSPNPASPEILRVAYVVAAFPVPSERFIQREVEALREQGLELTIVTLAQSVGSRARSRLLFDAAVMVAREPRRAALTMAEAFSLRATERGKLKFLWRFIVSAALVHELISFRPHVVHAHFANAPATHARLIGRWLDVPWGVSAHAHDIYVDKASVAQRLATASHVIACSNTTSAYLRDLLGAEAGARVHCVHHGIRIPEPHRVAITEPSILAAGRFVPKKGFDLLILALANLRRRGIEFTATLVGGGPQEQHLRSLAHSQSILGFRLERWADPSRLDLLMRSASVLVVPLRDRQRRRPGQYPQHTGRGARARHSCHRIKSAKHRLDQYTNSNAFGGAGECRRPRTRPATASLVAQARSASRVRWSKFGGEALRPTA